MSQEGTLGRHSPGDVVTATRVFYTTDTRPHPPIAANVTAVLLYEGDELTTVPVSVTSVSRKPVSTTTNLRSFSVAFTFQVPDTGVYDSSLTLKLSCEVYQSVDPNSFVMQDLYETIVLTSATGKVVGALPGVVLLPDNLFFPYSFESTPSDVSLRVFLANTSIFSRDNLATSLTNHKGIQGLQVPLNEVPEVRASLMPYAAVWDVDGSQEVSPYFAINPSISLAMREVHDFVNKNTASWSSDELSFTPEQIMAALYNGACLFNSVGSVTDFNMTNAAGSIRQFWVQYSSLWLLQSQVMNSIDTDFSFTNSSVTLDVDRASKYQQFADTLQSQLDERARNFKTILAKRGNISGDGSANPLSLRPGAIAALGLAMSPVSKVGYMLNPLSWRAALLGGSSNVGFQSY